MEKVDCPWKHGAFLMLRDAIENIKGLTARGLIVDGKPIEDINNKNKYNGFTKKHQIQKEIEFFTGGAFAWWVEAAGFQIDSEATLEHLGLKKREIEPRFLKAKGTTQGVSSSTEGIFTPAPKMYRVSR